MAKLLIVRILMNKMVHCMSMHANVGDYRSFIYYYMSVNKRHTNMLNSFLGIHSGQYALNSFPLTKISILDIFLCVKKSMIRITAAK